MQANLKPCLYRFVDNDGHILCSQIRSGERQVSPAICNACPIAEIDCTHLRATLNPSRTPLTVRWGNGKSAIWDTPAPPIVLERAACSAKTIPILSPYDCVGCSLRQALVKTDAIPVMPKRAAAPSLIKPESPERSNIVAKKIIQLQEWLAKPKDVRAEESVGAIPITLDARPVQTAGVEKRAGWTD